MTSRNPIIALALVSGLLWTTSAYISSKLAGKPSSARPDVSLSQEELLSTLKQARSLRSQAKTNSTSALEAMHAYQRVLQAEPKHQEALIELARLSFEHGVVDRSYAYFERYLEFYPEDVSAQVDAALVLVELGQAKLAATRLSKLLHAGQNSFQILLAAALAHHLAGDDSEARKIALEARKKAEGELALSKTDELIKQIETSNKNNSSLTQVSPASQIQQTFENHPILGPKIQKTKWESSNALKLDLENFPVENMPDFARKKFISSIQEQLKGLSEKFKITLIDADSKRELMQINVGGLREPSS